MEKRYREVKCSERVPDWYKEVIVGWYNRPYEIIRAKRVKERIDDWEILGSPPDWWLEPIPPEAEEQQSQVGEVSKDDVIQFAEWLLIMAYEQIDIGKWKRFYSDEHLKACAEIIDEDKNYTIDEKVYSTEVLSTLFFNDHDYRESYMNIDKDTADYLGLSRPTPKKVPTVEEIENAIKSIYNSLPDDFHLGAYGDRILLAQALHSLLPDTIQNGDAKACEHSHVMYISPIKKWLCYDCERLFNRIPNVIKSEPTK